MREINKIYPAVNQVLFNVGSVNQGSYGYETFIRLHYKVSKLVRPGRSVVELPDFSPYTVGVVVLLYCCRWSRTTSFGQSLISVDYILLVCYCTVVVS